MTSQTRCLTDGERFSAGKDSNVITTQSHWNAAWAKPPRMRLPSPVNLSVRNSQRLLRAHVKPGMRFLEIGCAPGKSLAWVGKVLGADVSGIDYSENGMRFARQLFKTLGIEGDLRCEDVCHHSFEPGSFDCVYSCGVIEHFHDPREIVRQHVMLLKPGGKALITVPNLRKWWGKPTQWLDPNVLSMHNLDIMHLSALFALAPSDLVTDVRTYYSGRVSVHHAIPVNKIPHVGKVLCHFVDLLGLLQPVDIPVLCPQLVLEMIRTREPSQ